MNPTNSVEPYGDAENQDTKQETLKNSPDAENVNADDTTSNETDNNLDVTSQSTSESESDTDWQKRYVDNQSYSQKRINEKDREIEKLRKQVEDNQFAQLPSSAEELDSFATEQPQLFNMITRIVEEKAMKTQSELGKSLADIESKNLEISNAEGLRDVAKTHPDVNEIRKSPEFITWFEKQTNKLQGLINDDYATVDDIVFVLDKYKKDSGKKNSKASKKKAATEAASIATSSSKGTPASGDGTIYSESMVISQKRKDPTWFSKNEKEIDKARHENRFVYDISRPELYVTG